MRRLFLFVPLALIGVVGLVAATQPSSSAGAACVGSTNLPSSGALSPAQVEGVWIAAGGPANVAPTAAAIADAESTDIPSNIQQGQPYGTTGWGLWQITPGNSEPQFGVDQALLVPINNARAAVAKYTAANGFSPWTTYTSGAYLQHMTTATATSVSFSGCATSAGGDPIPGFTPSRDDMGVDACSTVGQPIYAVADSTLVDVLYGWYAGQPLLLFQFNPPVAGTYQGDQYWYVAEQIVPASTTLGTTFAAGQPVATYAASGTCIEMGFGSPTTGSRTLVPTDANPPAGGLTPEAEAWKTFAHIPWVGVSP